MATPLFDLDARGAAGNFRDALWATAGGTNSYGLLATGSAGASGAGVRANGGDGAGSGNASPGLVSFGGDAASGVGWHGVQAFGGSSASGAPGHGVVASSTAGKGVLGQSTSGDGVHGTSTYGVGLRGTSPNFVGLVGISDANIGRYGYTVAPNVPALYAEHLGPSGRIAGKFFGDVQVTGNFTVSGGAKNAAVPMPDGSEAVLYCQESPEPYFEDFGRARLVNGVAHVQLEPEFASIVKRDDYMVYPVAEGDTKGLFIARKDANGFEVREAQGGASSAPFTYRVVAKRKDIEGKRLARLDPQVKANIGQMRSAAPAKNHPSARVPPGGNPLVPLEPIPPMPQRPAPRPERKEASAVAGESASRRPHAGQEDAPGRQHWGVNKGRKLARLLFQDSGYSQARNPAASNEHPSGDINCRRKFRRRPHDRLTIIGRRLQRTCARLCQRKSRCSCRPLSSWSCKTQKRLVCAASAEEC